MYNYISYTKKYVQYQLFQKILLRIMNHAQQENVEKKKTYFYSQIFPLLLQRTPRSRFATLGLLSFPSNTAKLYNTIHTPTSTLTYPSNQVFYISKTKSNT